jgi:Skp family chaperone for outer membrane proteins
MKKRILILTVLGFMAGSVLINGKNAGVKIRDYNENIGKTEQDTQTVKTSYSEDWQKFKSDSEQKIQDNEKSIVAFKDKMAKSGKSTYNKEIAKLEKTNRKLQKKLDQYKDDGKNSWEKFKKGFNKELDKIGKAVNDLTSDND